MHSWSLEAETMVFRISSLLLQCLLQTFLMQSLTVWHPGLGLLLCPLHAIFPHTCGVSEVKQGDTEPLCEVTTFVDTTKEKGEMIWTLLVLTWALT